MKFTSNVCIRFIQKLERTDFGAGCVQLWIRSAEPPEEHRFENNNNNDKAMTRNLIHISAKIKAVKTFPPFFFIYLFITFFLLAAEQHH